MKSKQTPLSYLVRVVTIDGLEFTSKIILWVILLFIAKEIIPCVSAGSCRIQMAHSVWVIEGSAMNEIFTKVWGAGKAM